MKKTLIISSMITENNEIIRNVPKPLRLILVFFPKVAKIKNIIDVTRKIHMILVNSYSMNIDENVSPVRNVYPIYSAVAVFLDIFLIRSGKAMAHTNSRITIIMTIGEEKINCINVSLVLVIYAVIKVISNPIPNQLYTLDKMLLLIISPSF